MHKGEIIVITEIPIKYVIQIKKLRSSRNSTKNDVINILEKVSLNNLKILIT